MPCYSPLNVRYLNRVDGKKHIIWSERDTSVFYEQKKMPSHSDYVLTSYDYKRFRENVKSHLLKNSDIYIKPMPLQLPCSKCLGCRLERSRQWAVRCYHEASLYEDNSFVTFTFDREGLLKACPDGSLNRRHMQLFMKRLRSYVDRDRVRKGLPKLKIRTFYAGEYGSLKGRPHYHMLLFNYQFPDLEYFDSYRGNRRYTSEILQRLWSDPKSGVSYGKCIVGNLTYQSAAYVARYCLKKTSSKFYERLCPITGEVFKLYPEFCQGSNRPGIGKDWFDKFGMTDIFPLDECVIDGFKRRPPRYYDKLLERRDPEMFKRVKAKRVEQSMKVAAKGEMLYDRLTARKKVSIAKIKLWTRTYEAEA